MTAAEETDFLRENIETEVARTIAACDGDPLAAVRALIVLNAFLESEVERLTAQVSRGFVRNAAERVDHGADVRRPIIET